MIRMFKRLMSSETKRTPIPVFGIEGRYVSALYNAAVNKKEIDDVEKHMISLQKVLLKPVIVDFIETSMMSRTAKAKLLGTTAKEAGMPSTAANFLEVVAENGRLKMLRHMITMFLSVMVAHRNKALCEVITAKPLDEATRGSLIEALNKFVKGGKKVELTEKVDPSIIGGMIVGIEDKHVDMSIAKKVQMYTEILEKSV